MSRPLRIELAGALAIQSARFDAQACKTLLRNGPGNPAPSEIEL